MLHLTVPAFSRCETAEPPSPAREGERATTDQGSESPVLPSGAFEPDLLINLGLNHSSTAY